LKLLGQIGIEKAVVISEEKMMQEICGEHQKNTGKT